jgi:hypothetical protein
MWVRSNTPPILEERQEMHVPVMKNVIGLLFHQNAQRLVLRKHAKCMQSRSRDGRHAYP